MIVVADASPLLALSRALLLDLVPAVHPEVLVPAEVWSELVDRRPGAAGVDSLLRATWIRVVPDVGPIAEEERLSGLDPGEAAALRVAVMRGADRVLMDERAGRRVAALLGVSVQGTLALLVEARRCGALASMTGALEALQSAGFRATPALRAWALRAAGEGG